MQAPLKHGLNLVFGGSTSARRNIRMQDPLKQGLKLCEGYVMDSPYLDSNARYIKTRIETQIDLL